MTAVELLTSLKYNIGSKMKLYKYEKEFILQRAIELGMSVEELENLKHILKHDLCIEDRSVNNFKDIYVYNLEDGSKIDLFSLYKRTGVSVHVLKEKIDNKVCIAGVPYSFDLNETPIFYKMKNSSKGTYFLCNELNIILKSGDWKLYFKDSVHVSNYVKYKYKNLYTFKSCNLYIDYLKYKEDYKKIFNKEVIGW